MKTNETTTDRLLGRIAVAVERIAAAIQSQSAAPAASIAKADQPAPPKEAEAFAALAAEVSRLAAGLDRMTRENAEAVAARRELAELRRAEMRAVLDELGGHGHDQAR